MTNQRSFLSPAALACALTAACTADGGMDGAGHIAPTLRTDQQVFLQEVWQDEQLSYVLFNERQEDIEVVVRKSCGYEACIESRELARWSVPAQSVHRFERDWPGPHPAVTLELGNGASLGHMVPPSKPPSEGTLPIVSNTGGADGVPTELGQIETPAVAMSDGPFTIALKLTHTGQLRLRTHEQPSFIPWLDVLDARSAQGAVRRVGEDLLVDIPASATAMEPALVEVDVALPSGAEDRLVAGFTAFFCVNGEVATCGTSSELTRWVQIAK